jgi:FtsP/CotA-like multicopper oxidase with cupredoxin domain
MRGQQGLTLTLISASGCAAQSRLSVVNTGRTMTHVRKLARCLSFVFVASCAQLAAESHHRVSIAAPNDNTRPAGALKNGVLSVSLEMRTVMWYPDGDTLPGLEVAAFAESGAPALVPGPLLRMPAGSQVELSLRNSISDTLTFFVPRLYAGQEAALDDSVVIPPGAVRKLSFTAQQPGNYSYRATTSDSFNRFLGINGALTGALVVDSAQSSVRPDRVFVIHLITDSLLTLGGGAVVVLNTRAVLAINGRSWPHTERLSATVGDSLHWRVINASAAVHPLHMHGFYFRVDDTNGPTLTPEAKGRMVVTERLSAFSAMSMTWVPQRAGNWLFHCHIQGHMVPHRPLGSTNVAKTSAADHQRHAFTGMGGLILGVQVAGARVPEVNESESEGPRRKLRLVAVQDSGFPADGPSLRFRLEERGEATRDAGPGISPPIVLQRGKPVSITVVNHLREPTAVHWHGIELESYYDGVAGFGGSGARISPIIAPSDSFEARFTPPRAGTFIYHSHVDEPRQHRAGLLGALIVQENSHVAPPDEFTLFMKTLRSDGGTGPAEINGHANPDTIVLRLGRTTRLRFINLTLNNYNALLLLTARPDSALLLARDTLLLPWRPLAKDGALLPPSERQPTTTGLTLSIGETRDLEVTPTARGHLRIEIRGAARGGGPGRLITRIPVRVE